MGKLDNRLRIYKEIINAVRVREAVGNDFIVGIRFSQQKVNDAEYLWPEEELAAKQIFSQMEEVINDFNFSMFSPLADLESTQRYFDV